MENESADPRPVEDPSPTGVNVMIEVIEAIAKKRIPAGYRVVYRTNPKGEHVVAVIWPPPTP